MWSDPHAGWDSEERYLEAMSGSGHKAVLQFQDGASSPIADGVVLDGPAGREIFLAETEAAHRRALAAGAAVRLLGDGDRPTLLWARLEAGAASTGLRSRLALGEIETTALRVEDGEAPPPAPNAGASRNIPAGLFDPYTAAQNVALISRDGRCYGIPRDVLAKGIVTRLSDCAALGAQQSEAEQGHRVWIGMFGGVVESLNAQERSFKRGQWRVPGALMNFTTVEIQPLPDHPGDLVAVVPRGGGFLAQWRLGSQRWLSMHDEAGAPTSPPIDPEMEGELFLLGEHSGKTCFLRWEASDPVELTCAEADVELARAQ